MHPSLFFDFWSLFRSAAARPFVRPTSSAATKKTPPPPPGCWYGAPRRELITSDIVPTYTLHRWYNNGKLIHDEPCRGCVENRRYFFWFGLIVYQIFSGAQRRIIPSVRQTRPSPKKHRGTKAWKRLTTPKTAYLEDIF